jgi:hypothetical protein
MLRSGKLKLIAQRGDELPPADLEYMLQYYVNTESENQSDITVTRSEEETGTGFCTIWKSQEGTVFQTALLFHTENNKTNVVGAVALVVSDEVLSIPGWDFFSVVAEALVNNEHNDASAS